MPEQRFGNGPLDVPLGYQQNNEGVGLIRTFSATKFTATATFKTKYKAIQGVVTVLKGTAAPAANTPVFFKYSVSTSASIFLKGYTSALGVPAAAATVDIYVKATSK